MSKLKESMLAATLICGTTSLTSCIGSSDNPVSKDPKSEKIKATDYS